MADHYNYYPLKHFADIVATCMELPLPGKIKIDILLTKDVDFWYARCDSNARPSESESDTLSS